MGGEYGNKTRRDGTWEGSPLPAEQPGTGPKGRRVANAENRAHRAPGPHTHSGRNPSIVSKYHEPHICEVAEIIPVGIIIIFYNKFGLCGSRIFNRPRQKMTCGAAAGPTVPALGFQGGRGRGGEGRDHGGGWINNLLNVGTTRTNARSQGDGEGGEW